jgi:hypothetical protein
LCEGADNPRASKKEIFFAKIETPVKAAAHDRMTTGSQSQPEVLPTCHTLWIANLSPAREVLQQ